MPHILGLESSIMEQNEYVRMVDNKIQLPVITMEHQIHGTKIHLFTAMHVASSAYYEEVLSLLQQDDIVLYEMSGGGTIQNKFKKHFLFLLKANGEKFYRQIAQGINDRLGKKISEINDLLSADDSIGEDRRNRIREILGEAQQYYKKSSMQVVYQGDKIDYDHLPDNWKQADMMEQELISTLKVFSLDNFYALLFYLALIVDKKRIMRKYIDILLYEKSAFITSASSDDHNNNMLHKRREELLFQKIKEYEGQINNIGIFYGAGHMKSIEYHLTESGYQKKEIIYLDAMGQFSL